MGHFSTLWAQIPIGLIALAAIGLATWGQRRNELKPDYPNVSALGALAAFIIGAAIWSKMLGLRLKHGRLGLMDDLMVCNPYLFFWPLLLLSMGTRQTIEKRD